MLRRRELQLRLLVAAGQLRVSLSACKVWEVEFALTLQAGFQLRQLLHNKRCSASAPFLKLVLD